MAIQAVSHVPPAQHIPHPKSVTRTESTPKPTETQPASTSHKVDITV